MKKTLLNALRAGGKILLENMGKLEHYDVKESQSSIVTKADIESEKKIMEIIHKEFSGHNTLGEETGFQNRNSEFTWIVDPLDGTSNFAVQLPWFGVNICLHKNSNPIMSGCFLPIQNEIYFAEKGRGAILNGNPITVSTETELKNILAAYSLDYSEEKGKTKSETELIRRLVNNVRNLRSTNCLLDFCYTASGKLGACINQTTKIWDIAGPGLIIEEAGGIVTSIEGKTLNFELNENNYSQNYTIIASNKLLHPLIVKLANHGI